jgi:hypothetical protein
MCGEIRDSTLEPEPRQWVLASVGTPAYHHNRNEEYDVASGIEEFQKAIFKI